MKKNYLLIAILLYLFVGCNQGKIKAIQVRTNKNIETLAVLYLVSDVGLNAHKGSLSYEAKQYFNVFKNHELIPKFKELVNMTSLGEPVGFFLRLSEFPNAEISSPWDTGFVRVLISNQDIDDHNNFINQFIKLANDFYFKADIEKFIQNHKNYYDKCVSDVIKNLPDDNFITTMEKFYRKEFKSYTIIPSPILFPFVGFGVKTESTNGTDIYYVAGPFDEPDSTQKYSYGFNSPIDIREMSVHEFGHSFVNPTTKMPKNKELIENYSYLFRPIEKYMSEQGYRSWYSCVNEHIVRLGEIRIAIAMNDIVAANRLRNEYVQKRNFIYLPYLENKILKYENNKDRYQTFSDFFPELIDAFSKIDTANISQ